MSTLTKATANLYCRTCLKQISTEIESKNICINITTNLELQALIFKYLHPKDLKDEASGYPQNMCLDCFSNLQEADEFLMRAKESIEKLNALFIYNAAENAECKFIKDETQSAIPQDINKLMLKDTLMETESVMVEPTLEPYLEDSEMGGPDPIQEDVMPKVRLKSKQRKNSADTEDEQQNDKKYNRKSATEANAKLTNLKNTKDKVPIEKKKFRIKRQTGEHCLKQNEKCEKITKGRQKGTKNNFRCPQCNRSFLHKITLDAHVRQVHEGSKRPFQCDRCDKFYSTLSTLYAHIKEIHKTEFLSYTCNFPGCDRVFTSFPSMQKHKFYKHSDSFKKKELFCLQCGAMFNQKCNLERHRRAKHPTDAEKAEKGVKRERHQCSICKKLFSTPYTLKYHTLQFHSNEMNFECNVCGRRFAKKFMLIQHMLVHATGGMPCEHCGKQFLRKFELEEHIRAIHMNLKPFKCQYCAESFAWRTVRRRHIQAAHMNGIQNKKISLNKKVAPSNDSELTE